MKTRILAAIIVLLSLYFAFHFALREAYRQREISCARDTVFSLQEDLDCALRSDIPKAVQILRDVCGDGNLKQHPGSDLDEICTLQRTNAIRDIIDHLRIETGEDLGPKPEPWIEKYGSKEYCCNRANYWYTKGEYAKAIENYKVIELERYAEGRNGLAWIQATCPDERYRNGEEAVWNACHANHICRGKDWRITATFAAALAENGDFDRAAKLQTKAIDLAPTDKDKEELRSRLELYKQGKPYREDPKAKRP